MSFMSKKIFLSVCLSYVFDFLKKTLNLCQHSHVYHKKETYHKESASMLATTDGDFLSRVTYDDFLLAQQKLDGYLLRTPLIKSPFLSEMIKGQVYLKLENTQITHSFKARGALLKLLSLTPEEQKKGVVTVSAGNHGKAVSCFAAKMGISSLIIMPENTPSNKVQACQNYGAQIILHGNTFEEAFEHGQKRAKELQMTLIHPYEDPVIIAGQGTVGIELVEHYKPYFDAVIIPVGGGGLAAGVSRVLSARWPMCDIFGVQSTYAPYMARSLFFYRSNDIIPTSTIAEGIAIKSPGQLTQHILKDTLCDIFVVDEPSIHHAVRHLLVEEKQVVEGAGAAGIAALFEHPHVFFNKKVGVILCGGNIDTDRLCDVLKEKNAS